MEPRIDPKAAPEVLEAMLSFSSYLRKSGLEQKLLDLICLRSS